MKCKIDNNYGGFFPVLIRNNYNVGSDRDIAKHLNLEYSEYINFIIEYKGFSIGGNYFFETQEECQDFIENFLEPHLVMEELTR